MTPLVLVHGFMGGSAQWEPQRTAWAGGREFIALDLPGFGAHAEAAPLDTIGAYADWALQDLTGRGVQRFDLLGHSMGGMIVQEMISRAPERIDRLVLYATGAVGVLPGRFETIEESKARAAVDGPKATARRIAATWFLERDAAAGFEACARIAEASSLAAIEAGLDAMQGWSGVAQLPSIRVQTLVIWGDRDRTYPWSQIERLWRGIPDAGLAVVPGCAHAVHLEKPQLFNALIADFLTEA